MGKDERFYQLIEDLRERIKPTTYQTNKVINQLKNEAIEILTFQLVRQTVVVWIWCQSQAALEYIQRLYESNQLKDILFGLIGHSTTSGSIKLKAINIDSNEFIKIVGKFY